MSMARFIRIPVMLGLAGFVTVGSVGCFGNVDQNIAAITGEVNTALECQGLPTLTDSQVRDLLEAGFADLQAAGGAPVSFELAVWFLAGQAQGCGSAVCNNGTCPLLDMFGGTQGLEQLLGLGQLPGPNQ